MGETKNLQDKEAIKKIQELAGDIKTCVFTTNLEQLPLSARPIYTKEVDDYGYLWFFLTKEGKHYNDLQADQRVQLFYAHPGKSEFLSIYGTASFVNEKERIRELWSDLDKAWFENADDQKLAAIKVQPQEAFYWDTKHGRLVSLAKIAQSAISDKSKDDGVKGKLQV